MALGAAGFDFTLFIPVPPGFTRSGEVTRVITVQGGHVDRVGDVLVQIGDRVVEQLNDVLAAVGVSTRIFLRDLVVVGGLQQTPGPGGVSFTGMIKEVRVAGSIVHQRGAGYFSGISLHARVEQLLQSSELFIDGFFDVTITIIVVQRADEADHLHVFQAGHACVADRALLDFELKGMHIVAVDAGLVAFDVVEARVVCQAIILI
ncbi:MAG: hypothetical protein WBG94_00180, partial [Anaerolineales bacterium]